MAASDTSTAAVDARLTEVTAAVEHLSSDLYDVENDAGRILLPTAPLEGQTKAQWAETAERLDIAWQLFALLRDFVRHTNADRGAEPRLSAARRTALLELTNGQSLTVPPELIDRATAITGIDPPAHSPCSVDELAAVVDTLHRAVVGVLGRVAHVWDRALPEMTRLTEEVDRLDQVVGQAEVRRPNDLVVARRLIEDLRTKAASDPLDLSIDEALGSIEASIGRVEAAIEGSAHSARDLDEGIAAASAELESTSQALSEVGRRRAEAIGKIVGADDLPGIESAMGELTRLSTELEAVRDPDTDREQARRRLDRLTLETTRLQQQIDELGRVVSAGLDARDELRGRLEAYRAMASAMGRDEDPELDDIRTEAINALYQAPCDVAVAGDLVMAYQRALGPRTRTEDQR